MNQKSSSCFQIYSEVIIMTVQNRIRYVFLQFSVFLYLPHSILYIFNTIHFSSSTICPSCFLQYVPSLQYVLNIYHIFLTFNLHVFSSCNLRKLIKIHLQIIFEQASRRNHPIKAKTSSYIRLRSTQTTDKRSQGNPKHFTPL